MQNLLRHVAVGLLLMALPIVTAQVIKQTQWGPILASPINRQLGHPGAKVAIVEYSDFQCPSCAHMQPTVHEFARRYEGKIRIAYKYFPLTKIHPNSMSAAHAAECSAEQNKFWPFSDALFAKQLQWAPLPDPTTVYAAIATEVGLDMNRYQTCVSDLKKRAPIMADLKEGQEREVHATPTFFVGDERLVGGVFNTDGARTIERELRR